MACVVAVLAAGAIGRRIAGGVLEDARNRRGQSQKMAGKLRP
jgi:hypothetical protein